MVSVVTKQCSNAEHWNKFNLVTKPCLVTQKTINIPKEGFGNEILKGYNSHL